MVRDWYLYMFVCLELGLCGKTEKEDQVESFKAEERWSVAP